MIKPALLATLAAASVLSTSANQGGGGGGVEEFDEAQIFLEFNATDNDGEIVINIDADAGLKRLRITSPTGKRVVDLRSRDDNDLGLRLFLLETPEPGIDAVLEAYPEGEYRFDGTLIDGGKLRSFVTLSHDLPDAPVITFPLDGAVDVPLAGAVGNWNPVPGAVSYALELEQEIGDSEQKLIANILSNQTSFRFPNNWLFADTESQFGVAAIGPNGNVTVTEVQFTTEP